MAGALFFAVRGFGQDASPTNNAPGLASPNPASFKFGAFQVFKERGHRHPRAAEDRIAAQYLRVREDKIFQLDSRAS